MGVRFPPGAPNYGHHKSIDHILKFMELSLFLAKVLGLYLLIVCVALLVKRKMWLSMVEKLADSIPLMVVSGAFTLILGLALVVSHNVWTTDWRVIVTLLGWATIVKGMLRLFFPEKIKPLAMKLAGNWLVIWVLLFFLVGAYLIYIGFSS